MLPVLRIRTSIVCITIHVTQIALLRGYLERWHLDGSPSPVRGVAKFNRRDAWPSTERTRAHPRAAFQAASIQYCPLRRPRPGDVSHGDQSRGRASLRSILYPETPTERT